MRKLAFLFVALFTVPTASFAQTFNQGLYGFQGPDGLQNTLTISGNTPSQGFNQNQNLDVSSIFPSGCKLHVNVQSGGTVPAGYNESDFLKRKLDACSWTVNECGIDPKCDSSVVIPNDAKFFKKADQICAVYKGEGDSETAPQCYTPIQPAAFRNAPNAGAKLGLSIKVAPPK